MIRTAALLLALLAVLLPLSGCSGDTEMAALIEEARASAAAATSTFVRPEMETHKAVTEVPGLAYTPDFSPYSTDGVDGALADLLYARLYTLDETGAPVESLVRIHSVSASGEHRFSLDSDAVFGDGSPLTAADAAFSLRRVGFNASTDGKTLVVSGFTGEGLENKLALVPILREGTENDFFPLPSSRMIVQDGGIYDPDGVLLYTLVEAGTPEELLAAWQSGEIRSLTVNGSEPDAVYPHGRAWRTEVRGRVLYTLTFRTDRRAFSEASLRRAAAAAIDRSRWATEWLEPAYLFVPTWSYLWTPALEQETLDLLDRGRMPLDGQVILLARDDGGTLRSMAESIGWDLRQMGMNVAVSLLPDAAYIQALTTERYDMLLRRTNLPVDLSLAALTGDGPVYTAESFTVLQRRLNDACIITPLAFSKSEVWTHID